MVIVDAHCHVSPYWFEPVESLLFQMDRNGVEHAVLVQYGGQFDNAYLFECERRFPGRFVSVVLVDASARNATEELERLAEQGARGLRLRANTRSPGDARLAIWRKAAELGLPVSCGGTNVEFAADDFARVVQTFPHLPIILEHLGSTPRPDGEPPPYEIRRKVFSLARFPNVYIKVHGLGEFCERPFPAVAPFPFAGQVPPILEMAYQAFGPQRMMWGSDYPPVSSREGYRNALQFTMEQLGSKSEKDRELIFGGVALKMFGLR
jgi:L-fuconolactonase